MSLFTIGPDDKIISETDSTMDTRTGEIRSASWQYPVSSEGWTGDGRRCETCGVRPETLCRLCGHESCMAHASHVCQRCYRFVDVVRQAPEGATGFAAIDMRGTRPCGGRLIDGKCEFCDVTTIGDGTP